MGQSLGAVKHHGLPRHQDAKIYQLKAGTFIKKYSVLEASRITNSRHQENGVVLSVF
ncbi:hypothetical protein [Chryseobacterium salivictor]|uniref:hypothetical protein n=1 Tax=Chryseobacterium salivictor TaxID=2547600 RepID=UPI00140D8C4E|nr:hypothetical protein [Chryseobacterium salivictor]